MPAAVTLVRSTYTDADSFNAAAFNALTASSASVPDATPGTAGVMPATTTAAGLALTNAADAAAQRTVLGLVIGTNVQAYSATLAAFAAGTVLTPAQGGTGLTSLGSGVATFLGTPSSANLAAAVSDETGSGSLVFANSPTLVTPALGTPSSGTVTNLTGTASININGTVGATTPSTGVFTGLTVNDNTTLGSSNTDTVTFNARSASDFNPSADDTYDLGIVGHEWRNLNIDGTANIDSLVADTADINGGTIDGTTVGATTPSTGAFTTLSSTTASNLCSTSGLLTVGSNTATGASIVINTVGTAGNMAYVNFKSAGTQCALFGLTGAALGTTATDAVIFAETGKTINLWPNGGTSGVIINSTGLAVTGALSTTTNIFSGDSIFAIGELYVGASNSATDNSYRIVNIGSDFTIQQRKTGTWTSRVEIDSSGNVGIGTASPGSKLDVNGEIRIGNTVNTVSPTSPNRTVTIVIGGTTYYIHAKTTND